MTLGLSVGDDRDDALVALSLVEVDRSVNQRVQRVVLTNSHVVTWVVLGATLANDDVTSHALLTAEDLDAQSLSSRLTTVLRTTYTLFMCHNFCPPTV